MYEWIIYLAACIIIQGVFVGYLKHTDWGWGLTGNSILYMLDFTITFLVALGFGAHIYFAFPFIGLLIGTAIAWYILGKYYKWQDSKEEC